MPQPALKFARKITVVILWYSRERESYSFISWSYYYAIWSAIGIIMLSVCLSVMLWIVAKQYILQKKCLNKWIGSAPVGTWLYNSLPPTPTLSRLTAHFLNHWLWCYQPLKTYSVLCYLLKFLNLTSTFSALKQVGIKSRLLFETVNKLVQSDLSGQ